MRGKGLTSSKQKNEEEFIIPSKNMIDSINELINKTEDRIDELKNDLEEFQNKLKYKTFVDEKKSQSFKFGEDLGNEIATRIILSNYKSDIDKTNKLLEDLTNIKNKLLKAMEDDEKISGSGFMDTIKKGVNFLKTIPFRAKHLLNPTGRAGDKPTARFENYLDQNKDKKIESISVGKIPLSKGISTALYVLSGGKSAQKMKELDYDQLYHQYMIVKYKDGTMRKIEKNAVIEEGKPSQKELDNLHFTLPVKKDLTVKEMIDTASYNDSTFYSYDSGKNNCQITIKNILERNNLIQPLETGKILANPKAEEIINTLPAPIRGLPLVITNLASSLDAVYYGGANGTVKVFDKRGVSNPMLYSQLIVNGLL